MKFIQLKNGHKIPAIGMGTWGLNGKECINVVRTALDLGYRHFDTAEMYGNEEPIGIALKEAKIPRHELFITTKVWPDHLRYEDFKKAVDGSLKSLCLDYVDLILIHWPNPGIDLAETIKAMNDVAMEFKAVSIGVSNFDISLLKQAIDLSSLPIACNQVLFNYEHHDDNLLEFCSKNNVVLCAYAPLGRGRITKSMNATNALNWILDKNNTCVLPMSKNEKHLKENLEVCP